MKVYRSVLLLIGIFLGACGSHRNLISNQHFLKQPLYPFYGYSRSVYVDELYEKIRDSVVTVHYYKGLPKRSLYVFQYLDPVAEVEIVKYYSFLASDGFQAINTKISKAYLEQSIDNVSLEYYLNNKRVYSQKDVMTIITLKLSDIDDIILDVSKSDMTCKVNVMLKR